MDIFKELEKYACEPNISVLADYQEPDLYDKIIKEAINLVVEKFKKDGICISVDTDALK